MTLRHPLVTTALLGGLSLVPVTTSGQAALGVTPAATTSAPTSSESASVEPAPLDRPVSVTLVTGDVVTLTPSRAGQPQAVMEPRRLADGSMVGYAVHQSEGSLTVIPDDVAGLVPTVLDPSLFDVTGLAEMGYDDASTDSLPLIVDRASGVSTLAGASDALEPDQVLASIHATAVDLDKRTATDFGADLRHAATRTTARASAQSLGGIRHVWLDRPVKATALDQYLTQVKAQQAWDTGLTGAGVKVAVLDSGADPDHPTLAGVIDDQANFTDGSSTYDGNGHGTHVASLIAGNGALSDGARHGIAPGVDLITGKVLADDGFGQESWVIAGMEWAVDQHADVVNLSLGGQAGPTDDPLIKSLDQLTAESGTLFVVAAGNSGGFGPSPYTIESPGAAASALTVGAVTGTDNQAGFSSEGPTRGTYRLKPEVAAPGVSILGAKAGTHEGNVYTAYSGTSQATPLVAGAAALLVQQHPDWTWKQVKTQIVGTADPLSFKAPYATGSGRLDLAQATSQQLTGDLASVDFGYLRHPDDSLQTKQLTFTNDGDSPMDLTITDDEQAYGLGTQPTAPADALTADPANLTVPAHSQATTTFTLDPALIEDTTWQGEVTVSSGGTSVLNLPFGVYDEPERYDVSVHVIDRQGNPYAGGTAQLFNGVGGDFREVTLDQNGDGTVRVGPGAYSVFSRVTTPAGAGDPETFTIAGTAELPVTKDASITVDARTAERLDAPTVWHRATHPTMASLSYARHSESGQGFIDFAFFEPADIAAGRIFMTPTTPVTRGQFEVASRWRLEPDSAPKAKDPEAYELMLTEDRFTDPLSPSLSKRDLDRMARVTDRFHAVGQAGATDTGTAWSTDESGIALISWRPTDVPRSRVELFTADDDVTWKGCLSVPRVGVADLCNPLYATYAHNVRTDVTWADGLHPEVVDAYQNRTTMFIDTGLSDGIHTGQIDPAAVQSSTLSLTRNGSLVATKTGTFGYFPVPFEAGDYQLEQQLALKPDALTVSRSATTTWWFHNAPPADPTQQSASTPPILQVNYAPDVDEFSYAEARRPLTFRIGIGHLKTTNPSDPPPAVSGATFAYSLDDGAVWRPLQVERNNGAFVAAIPRGVLRPGDSVSVRVTASDAGGGRVDQRVIGMIPVR